jgi:hypothetical protein
MGWIKVENLNKLKIKNLERFKQEVETIKINPKTLHNGWYKMH